MYLYLQTSLSKHNLRITLDMITFKVIITEVNNLSMHNVLVFIF